MRVVSLFPAATEIVAALAGPAALVGVSHECDWPPEIRGLPRVTRSAVDPGLPSAAIDRAIVDLAGHGRPAVTIDLDLLRRLAPDFLIGQSVCDVCAVGEGVMAEAVAALDPRPAVVTLHAHDLSGVYADIRRVGDSLGGELSGEAEELVAGMRYRLHRLVSRSAEQTAHRAPRTLVLEWLAPPYVAGHWVPELVEAAGGRDVGAQPGARSRRRSWNELAALAPDVVVIAPCGFDEPRARREFAAVREEAAVLTRGRRVEFLDGGAYTSRPGPRLVDAAERLAQLIHR